MIQFSITTGRLTRADGTDIGPGYSGAPGYVDDAGDTNLQGKGPIPVGSWRIGQPINKLVPGDYLGPFCLPLTPMPGTETFGRSAFYIHGDNSKHDESASHGCIVAARTVREDVSADTDRLLVVVE